MGSPWPDICKVYIRSFFQISHLLLILSVYYLNFILEVVVWSLLPQVIGWPIIFSHIHMNMAYLHFHWAWWWFDWRLTTNICFLFFIVISLNSSSSPVKTHWNIPANLDIDPFKQICSQNQFSFIVFITTFTTVASGLLLSFFSLTSLSHKYCQLGWVVLKLIYWLLISILSLLMIFNWGDLVYSHDCLTVSFKQTNRLHTVALPSMSCIQQIWIKNSCWIPPNIDRTLSPINSA